MPDPQKTWTQEEHLERARQGAVVWNKWAEENPGAGVDFSGYDFSNEEFSFSRYKFPGFSNFSRTVFVEGNFDNADFSAGDTIFSHAVFKGGNTSFGAVKFCGGITIFQEVVFESNVIFYNSFFSGGSAHFTDAKFLAHTSFRGVKFEDIIIFDGTVFICLPDFRQSVISRHFSFTKIQILSDARIIRIDEDAEDKFRRLKELAIQSKDHEKELEFFAGELKAKALHSMKWYQKPWVWLYEYCSDFGRSVGRPFGWLVITWFLAGLGFANASKLDWLEATINGLKLSAGTLLPFISASRTMMTDAKKALEYEGYVTHVIDAAMFVEGILGLAFVFLIGLALRNRFRL